MYYRLIKKLKPIKNETRTYREKNIFYRLFISFPRQFIDDKFTRDPNQFDYFGVHLVTGRQGAGKSTVMAYLHRKLKYEYPKLKVYTNYPSKHSDGYIKSIDQLSMDNNGIYGELDIFDEIQNIYSVAKSKLFDENELSVVTMQRKVKRCILAGAHYLMAIAKPLRKHIHFLYYPVTLFGCLTICKVTIPECDDDGKLVKEKFHKIFFFVHDKELRTEYFDSYSVIKK